MFRITEEIDDVVREESSAQMTVDAHLDTITNSLASQSVVYSPFSAAVGSNLVHSQENIRNHSSLSDPNGPSRP